MFGDMDEDPSLSSNLLLHSILKPTYKPRKFNNKSAILTLLWSLCGLCAFVLLIKPSNEKIVDNKYNIAFLSSTVLCPVSGWLTDVIFRRYKVIKMSIFVLWVVTILHVVTTLLDVEVYKSDLPVFITALAGLFAFVTFQANAIQFGLDQLSDASSNEISSYISWFAWTYFLSFVVVNLSQKCVPKAFTPVSSLIGPLIMTLCLSSDMLFSDWLVKEPTTSNPIKLIFKVLKYAAKNKYPRLRSTYSLWNDNCSRIDIAKHKFGGPFTTDKVEDVKSFFRIVIIIVVGSLNVGLSYVVSHTVVTKMLQHYQDHRYTANSSDLSVMDCFEKNLVREFDSITMVVFIPIFEIILYPLLWKFTPRFGIMKKFILGMVIQLFHQVSLLVLEIVGHHLTSIDSSLPANFTVTCMLKISPNTSLKDDKLSLDFRWIVLTRILHGFSIYCLLTSTVEFVCAQSPYSMKGLLGGMIYSLWGISILLFTVVLYPFQHLPDKEELVGLKLGCAVWYFLTTSVLTIVLIVLGCVVTKWYSKHRKNKNIHDEQLFAVNFEPYS